MFLNYRRKEKKRMEEKEILKENYGKKIELLRVKREGKKRKENILHVFKVGEKRKVNITLTNICYEMSLKI